MPSLQLRDATGDQHAGVVHEDVEAPVGLDGVGDSAVDVVLAGDVAVGGGDGATGFLDQSDGVAERTGDARIALGVGACCDNDGGASPGEPERDVFAEPAAGAGDDCDSAGEVCHRFHLDSKQTIDDRTMGRG